MKPQTPRRLTHARRAAPGPRNFSYELSYADLNLRKTPDFYRVGRGEQGVLLVEPYKSEILPFWKFRTPEHASRSARKISALFRAYLRAGDFVGADMARKFLQMGFTRSRRYANHRSGKKYDAEGKVRPRETDPEKERSAAIFFDAWKKAEANARYAKMKTEWKDRLG